MELQALEREDQTTKAVSEKLHLEAEKKEGLRKLEMELAHVVTDSTLPS